MDDVWVRVVLLAGTVLIAGGTTLVLRRREAGTLRQVSGTGLAAGIYFFSSTTCPTCRSAREKMVDRVGEVGFSEIVWEENPRLISELGVDAVPAVLVVGENGAGTLYPGQPDRALRAV